MSVDIKTCTRREPTAELIRELTTSGDVPGTRVRAVAGTLGDAEWPDTIESADGTTLCLVELPEVLADPEDVDDLAADVHLDEADLPLWLVTLRPVGAGGERAYAAGRALAAGLVTRCGGWAFAGGDVVATGPDPSELLDPDEPPVSFVAVTAVEPAVDLLAKVRDRHVTAGDPVRVDSIDELAAYVSAAETEGRPPPLWVTTLTAEASDTLALAVAAAEFVMTADADVFDDTGERLPLPHTDLPD